MWSGSISILVCLYGVSSSCLASPICDTEIPKLIEVNSSSNKSLENNASSNSNNLLSNSINTIPISISTIEPSKNTTESNNYYFWPTRQLSSLFYGFLKSSYYKQPSRARIPYRDRNKDQQDGLAKNVKIVKKPRNNSFLFRSVSRRFELPQRKDNDALYVHHDKGTISIE